MCIVALVYLYLFYFRYSLYLIYIIQGHGGLLYVQDQSFQVFSLGMVDVHGVVCGLV